MGWNELSDPDMRTANFEFSCDVYREGVYKQDLVVISWSIAHPEFNCCAMIHFLMYLLLECFELVPCLFYVRTLVYRASL